MSITHLQDSGHNFSSPMSLTGVTAGSFLVAASAASTNNVDTSTISSVSDPTNGTWNKIGPVHVNHGTAGGKSYQDLEVTMWYIHNSVAGSLSVSFTGTGTIVDLIASEFGGVAAASILDVSATAAGAIALSTLTATSPSTLTANDLVITAFGAEAIVGLTTGTISDSAGYTLLTAGASSGGALLAYKLDAGAAGAAQANTLTTVNKCTMAGIIATFKPATDPFPLPYNGGCERQQNAVYRM